MVLGMRPRWRCPSFFRRDDRPCRQSPACAPDADACAAFRGGAAAGVPASARGGRSAGTAGGGAAGSHPPRGTRRAGWPRGGQGLNRPRAGGRLGNFRRGAPAGAVILLRVRTLAGARAGRGGASPSGAGGALSGSSWSRCGVAPRTLCPFPFPPCRAKYAPNEFRHTPCRHHHGQHFRLGDDAPCVRDAGEIWRGA